MGGFSCASCNKSIGRYDDYLGCAGCKLRFHAACMNVSEGQLTIPKQGGGLKAWRCVKCGSSGAAGGSAGEPVFGKTSRSGRESETSNLQESSVPVSPCDRCSSLVDYFTKVIDGLHEKFSREMKILKEQLVSEVRTALSEHNAVVNDLERKLMESRSQSTVSNGEVRDSCTYAGVVDGSVVIKPKDSKQTNAATKIDLLHHVNPVKSDLAISRVRHIGGGGVVISCPTSEAAARLSEEAGRKLSDKYTVRESKPFCPRIRVVGVTENLEADTFLSYMRKQNQHVFSGVQDDGLKVISVDIVKSREQQKTTRPKIYQAVIETNVAVFNKILSAGKLFIGYDCCVVYDAIEITRCFNCCAYHHVAKNCRSRKVCPRCSGEHEVRDCTSDALKCINCFNAHKVSSGIQFNHAAWDRNCMVYQRKLKSFRDDVLGTK